MALLNPSNQTAYGDFSGTVTTTPVQVFPDSKTIPGTKLPFKYEIVYNASATVDLWVSRTNSTPSVGGVGCRKVAPLSQMEYGYTVGFIPPGPLYAVAASGTVNIDAERY